MLGEPGGGGGANTHIPDSQRASTQRGDAERMVFLKKGWEKTGKGHFRARATEGGRCRPDLQMWCSLCHTGFARPLDVVRREQGPWSHVQSESLTQQSGWAQT